jgi:hypothetical protein
MDLPISGSFTEKGFGVTGILASGVVCNTAFIIGVEPFVNGVPIIKEKEANGLPQVRFVG